MQLQILVSKKIIFPWAKRQFFCDYTVVSCPQAKIEDQRGTLSNVKDKTEAIENVLIQQDIHILVTQWTQSCKLLVKRVAIST